ncbi:MAG: hypothetical protein E6I26_01150 [Chloroflexi bacterium]|nr:MAG: hypothetical protein E6I26_01150 [Chloroflexota bacterium]
MPDPTPTSHEPTTAELSQADAESHHPGDIAGEAHGPDDHGTTHGHDDHAHPGEALGPVDTAMWGAFAVGIAAGLLVVLCLVLTLSVIGSAA